MDVSIPEEVYTAHKAALHFATELLSLLEMTKERRLLSEANRECTLENLERDVATMAALVAKLKP